MSDTFPRQYARTQRLTLGEPRNFTVSPDGQRVVFVRSLSGDDPVHALWMIDTQTGTEQLVLHPRSLDSDLAEMTEQEKRRRERAREGASGIVSYACDAQVDKAVTILGGQVVLIDFVTGEVVTPAIEPGVFDVRLSPNGQMLSYVRDRALCIATLEGVETVLCSDPSPVVSWGSAEFIAAEEMGRFRGYWWSPDSTHIATCRVDVGDVANWYIADPAQPQLPATEHRYPHAGSANAHVALFIAAVATGHHTPVTFANEWEYLTHVAWTTQGLICQTQTRNQQRVDIYTVDPLTGQSLHRQSDTDDAWVELVPGLPVLLDDNSILSTSDKHGVRQLFCNDTALTPPHLQCRSVVSTGASIIFIANELDTPWIHNVYSCQLDGTLTSITTANGVCSAQGNDNALVLRSSDVESVRAQFAIVTSQGQTPITSHSEIALVAPNVRIVTVGPSNIPVAIVSPTDSSTTMLPILFDPYGGPHAQRVVASRAAYYSSQWFADQGFIVVIVDNAGTPGKGSAWERAVHHDLAGPVLDDQLEVLDALSELEPRADLSRVAIRGWSFGGYLAALAVLRRSDRFQAAIAGAPVTDWNLYDTHYTERYLGHPSHNPDSYQTTSLLHDVSGLTSPLLLIHGLADDNVVAAHTLQLSSALLAAGKYHEVLPLSGVTHMTPQEDVAENLLLHQLQFLRRHLQ